MALINLLPRELKPKSNVLKISKALNKVVKIMTVLALVAILIIVGVFLVLTTQISQSQKSQGNLKIQIQALEETEKRLFLLRDRLEKIKKIKNSQTTLSQVDAFEDILNTLNQDVVLKEAQIGPDSVVFTFSAASSKSLSKLFTDLTSQKKFKSIKLSSLEFTPQVGYRVKLSLER